ncbi:unnamed protein product, partial [Cladocopium goreaui]
GTGVLPCHGPRWLRCLVEMAHWSALDLRSMRSLQSQSRSQQRILNSQASLRQRVLASNQASNVVSGQAKAPPENEVDVLSRLSEEELCNLVKSPPALEAGDEQAKLNLLSMDRTPLRSTVSCPEWMLVHIYNLSETFVGANQVLTFSEGLAIGGAFHVGVEVYGAEWSYGVYGVACDPPRAETAHVYECSVFVGATAKDPEQAAEVLFRLCQEWHGRNYDVLSHNCCSFGRRFVEELGVGPMPLWIDRFARTLHGGRDAVRHAGKAIYRGVMEDVPAMAEVARPHVERYVSDASAFAARKRQQASQKLHQVVMHDMPAMIETARPHVEQAAFEVQKAAQQKAQEGYEVMQKVVQEDAPKAMAAAQPYVEQAMNTAMYHGSNAMSSAQEAMQIAAEALHQQLFGEEESSSEDASPEAMEAEQRPMAPMAPMAQAMPTPGSLPRTSDPLPDAAPFRASSLQGSSEGRRSELRCIFSRRRPWRSGRCCKVQLLLSPPFLSRLPPRRSLPGGSSALLLPRMRGSWCRGSLATLSGRIRFNGRLACIRRHHGRNRFPGCLPYHGHLCHLGHCRCPCRPRPCRRRRRRRGQGRAESRKILLDMV